MDKNVVHTNKVINLLKSSGIQTVCVLVLYTMTADLIPYKVNQYFYTISLFIKDIIVLVMPITITFFMSYTISTFGHKAFAFVVSIIIFMVCSNFISVWYAYASAHTVVNNFYSFTAFTFNSSFKPLWTLPHFEPTWWSCGKGCIAGIILGCINAFYKSEALSKLLFTGKQFIHIILTKIFARLTPILIVGFAAQIYHTQTLKHILINYTTLILWLIVFLFIYIFGLFSLSVGSVLSLITSNIKNLLQAGMLALTSGSSLSTMPWTISGVRKNLKNPDLAEAIIPATTNVQQIGDCIANTFLCCVIYIHFYGHIPDLIVWLKFSIIFVLARYATAAVIGGAIFVMLPIYETYLGFNQEMIAIILSLNIMLDSIITASNVMANSALCVIFEKIFMKMQLIPVKSVSTT